jgi:cytochrome d ubiquinol oxidase subunit II
VTPAFLYDVFFAILGLGLIAYVLTGGADLGAGAWDLFASGPRKAEQRRAIQHAIAPIWEANHVWMIFVIVVMFSAFPRAFAVLATALHVPIGLSLIGLVLRGSAFVFQAYGIIGLRTRTLWAAFFAWSSLITPVALGTVIAALGSGAISVERGRVSSAFTAGWTSLFAISVGVFALALCALLAACYLVAETQGDLRDDFRSRAQWVNLAAGVLAFATLGLAQRDAPLLFDHLIGTRGPLLAQAAAALAALGTMLHLRGAHPQRARYTAAAQVALVLIGWGLAMDRHLVLPALPLHEAGAQPAALPALLIALGCGTLVLAPALFYLFRVFKLRAH